MEFDLLLQKTFPLTQIRRKKIIFSILKKKLQECSAHVRPESTSQQPVSILSLDSSSLSSDSYKNNEITWFWTRSNCNWIFNRPHKYQQRTRFWTRSNCSWIFHRHIRLKQEMLFIGKKFDGILIVSSKTGDSINDAKPLKLSVNKEMKGIGLSNIKESPASIGLHN